MDFTVQEYGALLAAIGFEMMKSGCCAGACRDGNSDDSLLQLLREDFGIEKDRAKALLEVELSDAITFNPMA